MINDKYLQAFAHFYRGEMNRLTIYRSRLDSTFQYSIILSSGLLLFYLQQSKVVSRYFPFSIIFMNLFFCIIETRRYRYYLISKKRVSIMEEGFLCNQILDGAMEGDWPDSIKNVYLKTEFTRTFWHCFLIRYFRNYIWLIDIITILWHFIPPDNYWIFEIFCIVQHFGLFMNKNPDV